MSRTGADEKDAFPILAYNRLLTRQYEEAALFYRYLSLTKPQEPRWGLALALCLTRQGLGAEAARVLSALPSDHLNAEERALFNRLRRYAKGQTGDASKKEKTL